MWSRLFGIRWTPSASREGGEAAQQSCGRLERFHRTLKEECIWLRQWDSLAELETAVAGYVGHYNTERVHSALGYLTPMEMHRLAIGEKSSLQIAA